MNHHTNHVPPLYVLFLLLDHANLIFGSSPLSISYSSLAAWSYFPKDLLDFVFLSTLDNGSDTLDFYTDVLGKSCYLYGGSSGLRERKRKEKDEQHPRDRNRSTTISPCKGQEPIEVELG